MSANRIARTPCSASAHQLPISTIAMASPRRFRFAQTFDRCRRPGEIRISGCEPIYARRGTALISEATVAFVEGIAAEAERFATPCGDGTMAWRSWGQGAPLVLLHGGYGSWMHWIRNVPPLSRQFRVIAPDLPGLRQAATARRPRSSGCRRTPM